MDQQHAVIIVGAGLSGLATAHFLAAAGTPALLLEADGRAGGAIRSFNDEGYRAEWGPHGFLDNNPASRQLLQETGLEQEALKAPLGQNVRYVCHHGRLVALPQSPQALLTTPLLSLAGKLRLALEPFKKTLADGASIGQWAEHRFGREVLPLVDAAVTGTFAGDYQRLSIDAVMPGVRRLEKEHGSLLRGLWRERRQRRSKPPATTGAKSGPAGLPAMTSFPQGMEQLITRLSQQKEIVYQCRVEKIRPLTEGGWEITTNSGPYQAKRLVLALPVNQALELLADFKPPVGSVPEARIVTVALGFSRDEATIPAGFGYLAPERENRFTLGALFSSHMFPERAPAGHVLLEALVGGRRHPERLELDDAAMIANIYQDLRQLLPLKAPPAFARVLRGAGGIPQLEQDHPRLLAWREKLATRHPSLQLTGFGWDGIGMNDMMKAAQKAAELITRGRQEEEQAAVRPVYF
ncbi:protoporphyrinogen oxidase [Desulfurivibrio alkaliphilus]|uniref:Coproporphyrinogen III oxidase n=1 Tax=Desulfurivibrio alkaliphilus (strain DSM 19089 / UNIQEM U267 / AHT2) TaxID=589865 RepID=D6Z562_DESAT|nr:protoporphyrinogen oxidase [Desulfurivibrio alkaliphilus]ADH84719.1 protoporphyrinogen oxidase [Desulfurivibrio alkaliphilus AHT 2]